MAVRGYYIYISDSSFYISFTHLIVVCGYYIYIFHSSVWILQLQIWVVCGYCTYMCDSSLWILNYISGSSLWILRVCFCCDISIKECIVTKYDQYRSRSRNVFFPVSFLVSIYACALNNTVFRCKIHIFVVICYQSLSFPLCGYKKLYVINEKCKNQETNHLPQ